MTDITLSPGQDRAFKSIAEWHKDKRGAQEFVLAGYAGTGKSTLADLINQESGGQAMFCAFTGKAANVLREKGNDASTLHSALYKPTKDNAVEEIEEEIAEARRCHEFHRIDGMMKRLAAARLNSANKGPGFKLNHDSVLKGAFVIVDEYSMLPEPLITDLRTMAAKILYLGDPFQLPPVQGTCILEPNAFLDEIHRQALDSPIVRYATDVRLGKVLQHVDEPGFLYGPKSKVDPKEYDMAEQIIVGRNNTRMAWNRRFRQRKGYTPDMLPQPAEKIICLKNNAQFDLFNGMICQATLAQAEDSEHYVLEASDGSTEWDALNVWMGDIDGRDERYDFRRHRKYERFDFAYAITCHKSQGSEFESVLVYDEPIGADSIECARWRYTALTRAKKKVVMVDPR